MRRLLTYVQLSPVDIDTIIDSVEKTNRVVVVQEAQRQAGVAANVVAEIPRKSDFAS